MLLSASTEPSDQIFRYAIAHELADSNPAAAFKPSYVLEL